MIGLYILSSLRRIGRCAKLLAGIVFWGFDLDRGAVCRDRGVVLLVVRFVVLLPECRLHSVRVDVLLLSPLVVVVVQMGVRLSISIPTTYSA